jgi:cell division septation protein DedD
MDVGFYLGELLMQQGEVSVPGLGYFVQVRVSGYYNDEERKFYPPYHKAQFDVQSIDDDSLAEYIANKKNISVASARYFAEKYITTLKQQAMISEVPIGNLGWFYSEFSQLIFKPADKIIDDTIFFGLEPISISKVGDVKPADEHPKVQLNYPPKFTPPPVEPETQEAVEPENAPASEDTEALTEPTNIYQSSPTPVSSAFFEPGEEEEEEQSRGPLKLILAIFIIVIAIGLGVFALYRYQPDTFARIAFWEKRAVTTDTIKPKEVLPAAADTTIFLDSARVDTSATKIDTLVSTPTSPKKTEATTQPAITAQVVTPPKAGVAISTVPITKTPSANIRSSDATGTRRFEVYVTPAKNIAEANALISKLKRNGLDPRIVTDAPGPLIHVSIGHFKTIQEAKAFAIKAQESGKVTGDAYPFEIIPAATAIANPISATATSGTRRFEVYVTPACKDMAEANRLVAKLKKNGLNAYVVTDVVGPLFHVSIGRFKTAQEAKAFAVKAQESGKVTGGAYANEIITAATAIATTGARRFEVYVTPACKDMAEANRLIAKLKKNGLNAYVVADATGPLIHVSIGKFKTVQEAKAFAVKAQESGKVTGGAYANEIITIAGTRRFEVYVTPVCKDMAEANRLIAKLKKNGLNAYVVADATGPLIQVSIGQFKTAPEAKAFAVKAQESGKVTGGAYAKEIITQ